jgi:hypothetical protein
MPKPSLPVPTQDRPDFGLMTPPGWLGLVAPKTSLLRQA